MLQTRKAHELDVVKLTEDLPQYDLPKGTQGTVVEVFDTPEEGYMVEFVESHGANSIVVDWVRPSQIENLDDQAMPFFKEGIDLLNQGRPLQAADRLRHALELKPTLIRILHNMVSGLVDSGDWSAVAKGMRFIIDLSPTYELARWNLAIAYANRGVEDAKLGNFGTSVGFLLKAFRIETPERIANLIRENLAAAHAAIGLEAHKEGDLERALLHMESAFTFHSSIETRSNLGTAYSALADSLLRRGKFEEAILNYIAAEESGVFTSEGLNNRAIAHVHTTEFNEAIEAFQTALTIDPENRIASQNLHLLKRNLPTINDVVVDEMRTEEIKMHFLRVPLTGQLGLSTVHA